MLDQWRFMLLAILAIASVLSVAVESTAQTPVKIGIVSPTFGHAPFYVARDKGFYKAEGLIGEVIVMNWIV